MYMWGILQIWLANWDLTQFERQNKSERNTKVQLTDRDNRVWKRWWWGWKEYGEVIDWQTVTYVIKDITRLQRKWGVFCEGKDNESENLIGWWTEMYCEEEDCASEEYMEIRFVFWRFSVSYGARKEKMRRWRENRYELMDCRSLYTVWEKPAHVHKHRILSTSSCRIPHPTGCYQIRFTYLFNGELNYNSYKDISGPRALVSQYWDCSRLRSFFF